MERKVKYDYKFKLRCVEEVLKKHCSVNSVAARNSVSRSDIDKWVSFYIKYGKDGLLTKPKNQNYTVDFKLEVIKTIKKKSLSLEEACLTFNIPTKSTIICWQRKFKEEGFIGLQSKPKGRLKVKIKRKERRPDRPLTREEELLRENERLRAENELLKKFNALVQAEQANQNKRLKP